MDTSLMDAWAIEEERYHALETWCVYERGTGDTRWPVLCYKDNKFATRRYCDECRTKREEKHA